MKAIFSSKVNWNTFIVGYVGHFESEVRSKSKYFVKIGWCWKKFWNYSKIYRKFWEIFGISGSWLGSGSARELSSSARLEDFWLEKSSARFWLVKFWLGSARNWKELVLCHLFEDKLTGFWHNCFTTCRMALFPFCTICVRCEKPNRPPQRTSPANFDDLVKKSAISGWYFENEMS